MSFPLKIKNYIDEQQVYLIKRFHNTDHEESFIPSLDLFLTFNGKYVTPDMIFKNCMFNDNHRENKCTVETEIFAEGGIAKSSTVLNIVDMVNDVENNIVYTVYEFDGTPGFLT